MPCPEVGKGCALIDAKQHLLWINGIWQAVEPVMLHLAALEPSKRPRYRRLGVLVTSRIFHTFIKGHGNVAAKIRLNLHGLLRSHENTMSVNMAGKGDALLLDLPQRGQ